MLEIFKAWWENFEYITTGSKAFDDIHDHAQVQSAIKTSICLDESIRSASDSRKALEVRAARVINIKVGRVGYVIWCDDDGHVMDDI